MNSDDIQGDDPSLFDQSKPVFPRATPSRNLWCSVPHGGVTLDREGYALAAGFAIGLINLGAGDRLRGYYYDKITETLWRYMIGGHDPLVEPTLIANQSAPPDTLLGPGGVPWSNGLDDAETVADIPILSDNLNRDRTQHGLEGEQANIIISQSNVRTRASLTPLHTDRSVPFRLCWRVSIWTLM